MKKFLPFIALGVIAILIIGGFLLIRRNNSPATVEGEVTENVPELPADQRPTAAIIPHSDGHSLKLKVDDIKVKDASSLDYEIIYKVADGRTQGIPGTIQLAGKTSIERDDLLLGSESSGKKRYDVGVETGTLTLRFRDNNGKMIGKVTTDFHLQNGVTELTSVDKKFTYTLEKMATGVWFITMQPFGTPKGSSVTVFQDGYVVYSSDGMPHSGKIS